MGGWEQNTEPEASWPATAAHGDANGAAMPWGSAGAGDTNGADATPATDAPSGLSKDQLIKKARDQGWTEAVAFDYEEFKRLGGNDADFHGSAKVYEWKGEYGDVAPEVPELEKMLFGGEFQVRRGQHFDALDLEAAIEGTERVFGTQVSV